MVPYKAGYGETASPLVRQPQSIILVHIRRPTLVNIAMDMACTGTHFDEHS